MGLWRLHLQTKEEDKKNNKPNKYNTLACKNPLFDSGTIFY